MDSIYIWFVDDVHGSLMWDDRPNQAGVRSAPGHGGGLHFPGFFDSWFLGPSPVFGFGDPELWSVAFGLSTIVGRAHVCRSARCRSDPQWVVATKIPGCRRRGWIGRSVCWGRSRGLIGRGLRFWLAINWCPEVQDARHRLELDRSVMFDLMILFIEHFMIMTLSVN